MLEELYRYFPVGRKQHLVPVAHAFPFLPATGHPLAHGIDCEGSVPGMSSLKLADVVFYLIEKGPGRSAGDRTNRI